MCNCQTCGKEEPEYALNDEGDCGDCGASVESLLELVCAGVDS